MIDLTFSNLLKIYAEFWLAITPPSPPMWRTYFVLSVGSVVTHAITAPLFVTADTSHDVAPSGIFILFSNIIEVILFLYVLLWKSADEFHALLLHDLIIGGIVTV